MTSSSTAVFFDLDHTLIDTSSGLLYYQYLYRLGQVRRRDVARVMWWLTLHKLNWLDVEAMAQRVLARYRGQPEAPIREGCDEWFEDYVKPRVFAEAVAALETHKEQGHHTVILSAASPYVCRPMQEHMGFDGYACTVPVVEDGAFTGEYLRPYCYGIGKVEWARRYAEERGFALESAYFYSDSISDLPMLERVGHPRIVNPDPKLRLIAQRRGWPVLRWTRSMAASRETRKERAA